jgi:hypothetical protein
MGGRAGDVITGRELGRATLARQLLLERHDVPVATAVELLAGLQAQEAKPPFTGLRSRLAGFRRDDLLAALADRTVVRGTLMRGTLHLVGAGDLGPFRSAVFPVLRPVASRLGDRAKGLDVAKVRDEARRLLAGRALTFNELRPLLVEAFPEVNDRALGYTARMHLPLVMVPTDDRWGFPRDSAFTLADEWLGATLPDPGAGDPADGAGGTAETAGDVAALALRYLAAFGPASAADFGAWSGLSGTGEVFERLRPELRAFRTGAGKEVFDLPDAPRPGGDVPAPVRFLPEFDNLVLAHADRSRLIDDDHRALVTTKNLRVRATFLVDGRVAGSWTAARRRKLATLTLTPFATLTRKAVKELTTEGEQLLRFVEDDATDVEVVEEKT